MDIWLTISVTILIVLMYTIRIARPSLPPRVSDFEMNRGVKDGDHRMIEGKRRRDMYPFARSVRSLVFWIVALTLGAVLGVRFGPVLGVLLTLVAILAVTKLSMLGWSINRGEWLYVKVRPAIDWLYSYRKRLFFLSYPAPVPHDSRIFSEDELLHVIDTATFLDKDRRELIQSALEFTGLTAADAMSGRRSIRTVDKGDVLGPLLLDELYRTGRSAFVVTDGGLDDIVGILGLEKLTSLDLKETPTALKAMRPEVHYIGADDPITDALVYLRSTKAPFLVVREGEKTVGLLSMDNILRCLFAD